MNLDIKSELTSLLKDNDPSFVEFLENNIKRQTINLSDFDDITEELFLNDPEYFMYFYYPRIQPLLKNFFPEQQVYEMERKIFEKLSLFKGESILTDFSGRISIPDNFVDGRIYLTNYRIVAHGILKIPENLGYSKIADGSAGQIRMESQVGISNAFIPPSGSGAGTGAGPGSGGGLGGAGGGFSSPLGPPSSFSDSSYGNYEGSREIWFNLLRGINFTGVRLNKEESIKTKACYGYQIPIINSSKISKKKNTVKYIGTFKNIFRTKEQRLKFKIIVSIPKGIKSKDINNEIGDILNLLEETITQYSIDLTT